MGSPLSPTSSCYQVLLLSMPACEHWGQECTSFCLFCDGPSSRTYYLSLYTFPVETCWFPCWMLRLLPVHSSHRRHHCLCKMSATSWFMHLLSSLKCSPMCSKSAQRVPSKASEGLQALATPSSPHLETALHLDLLLSVLVSGVLPLQRQSLPATAASPSLADPSLGSGYSSRLGSSIISSESPSKVKNLLV